MKSKFQYSVLFIFYLYFYKVERKLEGKNWIIIIESELKITASFSKIKEMFGLKNVVILGGCSEISFIVITKTIATLKWLADWFTTSKIRFFIVRVMFGKRNDSRDLYIDRKIKISWYFYKKY